MRYGNGRRSIHGNKVSVVELDSFGIGSEKHPKEDEMSKPIIMVKNEDPQYWKPTAKNDVEEKVFSIMFRDVEKEKSEVLLGFKLYLNTLFNFINLLFNKKERPPRLKKPLKQRFWSKIVNWNRKDTTNDAKDLIVFVIIHGLLGSSVLLTTLTWLNLDITIVQIIRKTIWITIPIYIIGSGSAYYLFCDINKVLAETWRNKRK